MKTALEISVALACGLGSAYLGNYFVRAPLPIDQVVSLTSAPESRQASSRPTTTQLLGDPKLRSAELAAILDSASSSEIEAWLSGRIGVMPENPELRQAARSLAYRRWFEIDSQSAWAYLAEADGLTDIRVGINAWSEINPEHVAAALAKSSLRQDYQRTAENTLLSTLINDNPELALSLVREHGLWASESQAGLLARVATLDMPKAVSMLEDIPTEPRGAWEAAVDQIGLIMAVENPADAYAWIQEVGFASKGTIFRIGRLWGARAPRQLLEQLNGLPVTAEDKAGLLDTAISKLWKQNPQEAKTYLESLELPENEAQIVEEALKRFKGNSLFR